MRQIPQPGQLVMYVELSMMKHLTVAQTLQRLEQMGYTPQLRYLELADGIHLFAVLRDEQHNPMEQIDSHYRADEVIALFEAFPGDEMAIHMATGSPKRQSMPLAS
jgi:hypothetical protein